MQAQLRTDEAEPERATIRPGAGSRMGSSRILVSDDQPDVQFALRLLLEREGYEIETADSPAQVLAAVRARSFELLILDLNYRRDTTSGEEGLRLLKELQATYPRVPVLVMTAWGTLEIAVEAMRGGASDFVLKPWDNARLLETVRAKLDDEDRERRSSVWRTRDLEIASRVQACLLPRATPSLATLEVLGRCVEAGAVGGDFYDFVPVGPGRLAIALADASGKGVSAALLAANLQASLRGHCGDGLTDLPMALGSVNRLFHASTAPEHYATLFFGVYEESTRRLRYLNCGHRPALLLRRDGSCQRLTATATALGLFPDWDGFEREVGMLARDTLLVFSDGVIEAADPEGEELGEARLVRLARRSLDRPLPELADRIVAAVREFTRGAPEDDLSIVVARAR